VLEIESGASGGKYYDIIPLCSLNTGTYIAFGSTGRMYIKIVISRLQVTWCILSYVPD